MLVTRRKTLNGIMHTMSDQALSGFKVLDLSESIAGQFCCRMMADFGADVTIVEPPSGSQIRSIGPFHPNDNGSLLFFHLNHGKKSIALDHRTEQGWRRLLSLVGNVDVVVVGTDIDRNKLAKENPKCVVALVSDFGDDGPYANWRGSEMIFQALSGMMVVNGRADRQPLYGVGHRASYAAGVGAYITVLGALYARKSSGRGQLVSLDVAMNTSSMAPPSSLEFAYSKIRNPRGEDKSPFMSVKCDDGWVGIWIYPHTWSPFCHAIGRPELAEDSRFATGEMRQRHWSVATALVQEQVTAWPSADLIYRLMKQRVLVAKAYRALELWDDVQHLKDRKYWQTVETEDGPRPILGPSFRLSATPRTTKAGPPSLGKDDDPAGHEARQIQTSVNGKSSKPLEGLRVLDFTTAWAGPMTGRILAFLGAEVIKVESSNRLDGWRQRTAVFQAKRFPDGEAGLRPYNRNALFNSQNLNKLSLALDTKNPKGLALVHRLVTASDVVICNFSAGTLDRMGLGYAALKRLKNDIVVMEMPGFGNSGPLSTAMANGATMEMAAGMCAMIGYPDGPPATTGQVYPDPMGGYNGAAAVLTALMHRQATGEGQYIEMPQVEASMQFIGEELLHAIASRTNPEPQGNRVRWAAPHDAYLAAGEDQWVTIAVETDAEWKTFCDVAGCTHLATDTRYATFDNRWRNQDELRKPIESWTRQHSKFDISNRLQSAGIRAAPVLNSGDLHESPYLKARQAFTTLTHAEAGTHDYQSLPFRLSDTPGSQVTASPCLGAHTEQILTRILGLTAEELSELDKSGITSNIPA